MSPENADSAVPDPAHDTSPESGAGAENAPGSDAGVSGRAEPGPPPPAANQQEGEGDVSAAGSGSSSDARPDSPEVPGPGAEAAQGEPRAASARAQGTAVVGRGSAPDGEVGAV